MGQLNQSLRPREGGHLRSECTVEEVGDKITAVRRIFSGAEVEGPWEEIVCKMEVGEN